MSTQPSPNSNPSVLKNNDNTPVWNISETTAYPVSLKGTLVQVYMSPYRPEELKEILKKAVSGYRREKHEVEIVREDRDIYTPLCDAHFVKLGNASGTPEAQRAFLDRHPELKPGIVELTFGGLQLEKSEETDNSGMLDISLDFSGSVKVFQDIYDEATGEIVRINMTHSHAHPTEQQYRQYRNARRNKFLRKSTIWAVTEQHGTLEKLYDEVVKSVSGLAVNGLLCTEKTKSEWIGSVPLWHKLWVCDQIFGEIVEKNA